MDYVGITGITKKDEINFIKSFVKKGTFMCGILVSYKILHGDNNSENKRYVHASDLYDICKTSYESGFFTILHYNTKNTNSFATELNEIIKKYDLYEYIDGFQLNIDLPQKCELVRLKHLYPLKKIIFSLNKSILYPTDTINLDLNTNRYLHEYFNTSIADIIDYVLIDLSKGLGKTLDVNYCANIYQMLKQTKYRNEIGFAGGLSDTNVKDIYSNIANKIQNTDFSIDAESKLRRIDDELDLEKVRKYLQLTL